METVLALTADQWLSLPDSKAGEVLGTGDRLREVVRRLAQHWHPDRNTHARAEEVFIRIQQLQAAALAAGRPLVTELVSQEGRKFRYQAAAAEPFELGQWMRAANTLAYQVDPIHQALFDRAVGHLRGLSFATPAMRTTLEPLLPKLVASPWGATGGLLVIRHDAGAVRLRDVLTAHAAPLDPRHVAWILSGLFNLACYLEYRKLAHQAITLESVWIQPARHEVALLGGWFHALPFGQTLTSLPAASAELASSRYLSQRRAGPSLDLELIRAVGRELLGDRRGQRLPAGAAPAPMRDFLLGMPSSALNDYRTWKQVLVASFGPPTFVPMPVSAKEIYKESHHG